MTINVANPLQNTADWLSERAGSLTASRMADALDFRKDGKPGAARVKLIKELIAERMTGETVRRYATPEMLRGQEEEPFSREAYEAETGNIVRLVGFIPHPTIEYCGASPDGMVEAHGLVEFKNPTTPVHLDWILGGKVPAEHEPQLLLQLACTRKQWVDFVSFDRRIRNPRQQLFIRRYEPTADEIAGIEEAARQFLDELEAMFRAFVEAA